MLFLTRKRNTHEDNMMAVLGKADSKKGKLRANFIHTLDATFFHLLVAD